MNENKKKLKKSTINKITLIASLITIFVFLTGKNLADFFNSKESHNPQSQMIQNEIVKAQEPVVTPQYFETNTNGIAQHPKDIEVYPSDTARFTVVASKAVKSYVWQYCKDGVTWKNVTVSIFPSAKTDTLTFVAHETHNGFQYRCIVHFEDGTTVVSDPAKLTVKSY